LGSASGKVNLIELSARETRKTVESQESDCERNSDVGKGSARWEQLAEVGPWRGKRETRGRHEKMQNLGGGMMVGREELVDKYIMMNNNDNDNDNDDNNNNQKQLKNTFVWNILANVKTNYVAIVRPDDLRRHTH